MGPVISFYCLNDWWQLQVVDPFTHAYTRMQLRFDKHGQAYDVNYAKVEPEAVTPGTYITQLMEAEVIKLQDKYTCTKWFDELRAVAMAAFTKEAPVAIPFYTGDYRTGSPSDWVRVQARGYGWVKIDDCYYKDADEKGVSANASGSGTIYLQPLTAVIVVRREGDTRFVNRLEAIYASEEAALGAVKVFSTPAEVYHVHHKLRNHHGSYTALTPALKTDAINTAHPGMFDGLTST